jgi:hypothetical protein
MTIRSQTETHAEICRGLIEAALAAIEAERLADADELLAKAMNEASLARADAVLDALELADRALGGHLLELAEGHLRRALVFARDKPSEVRGV